MVRKGGVEQEEQLANEVKREKNWQSEKSEIAHCLDIEKQGERRKRREREGVSREGG
jgi:hypothetical protein